jgi:hypothetical protein
MALTICCPCGNPLDCDHLELVVSLTCPRCQREIELEVQLAPDRHAFAILTIMEGPYWVGEQFVMPIAQDLRIGKAAGNWLSLESDALSNTHCRLQLTANGHVIVEDLKSDSGTWIGSQRIVRGRLQPLQSFSAGGFRFRLDMPSPDGTTVAMTSPVARLVETKPLPTLTNITREKTLPDQLIAARFLWSRRAVLLFAWITAVYHACSLARRPESSQAWLSAILLGLAIGAGLTAMARRLTIAHPYSRFVSLAVIFALAIADLAWKLPGGAIASLGLVGALAMLLPVLPTVPMAVSAGVLGLLALMLSACVTIRGLITLVSSLF